MTDTRAARERWGEEALRYDDQMSEAEIDRVLVDDDLWLIEPTQRYETLTGTQENWRTVRAWETAADFAIEMMQLAQHRGMFADGTADALAWILTDAHARAKEAARRERERLETREDA